MHQRIIKQLLLNSSNLMLFIISKVELAIIDSTLYNLLMLTFNHIDILKKKLFFHKTYNLSKSYHASINIIENQRSS